MDSTGFPLTLWIPQGFHSLWGAENATVTVTGIGVVESVAAALSCAVFVSVRCEGQSLEG